jgi:hypothetical protein
MDLHELTPQISVVKVQVEAFVEVSLPVLLQNVFYRSHGPYLP